jgi:hypothetical protein
VKPYFSWSRLPENRWRSQTIFSGKYKEKTCGIDTDYGSSIGRARIASRCCAT